MLNRKRIELVDITEIQTELYNIIDSMKKEMRGDAFDIDVKFNR